MGSKSIDLKNLSWPKTNKFIFIKFGTKIDYLTPLHSELTSYINMKLVVISLRFPTHINRILIAQVMIHNEKVSNYNLYRK